MSERVTRRVVVTGLGLVTPARNRRRKDVESIVRRAVRYRSHHPL
ncbi:MAG: hypothetical protein KatS3mg082_1630 [Nitrospiraceae bacterium]|nr:MAG: hypothetical protein KatS3mg082_1630 [Nitrospiraceae bacterium]